jgi:DNA-binding LacI/PurR family transcriptional regulator
MKTASPRSADKPAATPSAPRPTLADVASRAGVTVPTVSKVLNGRANCWASEETRSRIREAVAELGYRPNLAARGLASGCSHVIGFISPGFGVTSERSWAVGLTEAASRQDYSVTVSSHPNDSASEDRLIRRLLDRGVDGLAIYPTDQGPHKELRRLVASGFPVVTFEGANLLDFPSDDASVDLDAAGRLQARHLLALGRRRLCIANTLPAARVNDQRDAAIERELLAAGAPAPLRMNVRYQLTGEKPNEEEIYAGIRAFVARQAEAFDAVATYDPAASLTIRALLEHGLRVPEDVAVIGSGNGTVARYGAIPLSSIDTHTDEAAAAGFDLLLDRIGNRVAHDAFRRLSSRLSLVARRSTVRQMI